MAACFACTVEMNQAIGGGTDVYGQTGMRATWRKKTDQQSVYKVEVGMGDEEEEEKKGGREDDEYRIKPVEEVKYMKNGAEEEQKIAARNQENLEKSASSNARLKTNKEIPGLVHQPRANMHISESQQEFFRMLDEKIEKGRDYCSEEEDIT
ncbi:hypothetical protein HispidOSU_023596 [Sigmodon hispidus]